MDASNNIVSNNIVEEIRQNRKTGAVRLVSEYRDRLYKVACGICGDKNEAEDLVFRTFEQVIAKIDEYREKEAFFGWMCTILRNYHLMSLRATVARNTIPSGGLSEMADLLGEMSGVDAMSVAIDGDTLRKAVEELPPKLREVVVLHYFMDQPVRRVAKMLSVAKGTVKSRLYYARLVLSEKLCTAMKKKPGALLVAIGLFVAAAVSAVAFEMLAPPPLAEVDEPVCLDDAPVAAEDEEPGLWSPASPSASAARAPRPAAPRPRRSVRSAVVPAFRSDVKDTAVASVRVFNSNPADTRVIISR